MEAEEARQTVKCANMFEGVPANYHWLLPTGLSFLDTLLEGGLHKGMIAQLYGESGTGKTQLCMQMMLGASRYGSNSFYISSEKRLHTERFMQLKEKYEEEINQTVSIEGCTIRHCLLGESTFDSCYVEFLQQIEQERKQGRQQTGLLIVDNITRVILDKTESLTQNSYQKDTIFEKARLQKEFVNTLREHAKTHRFAVLLVSNAASPLVENNQYSIKHYSNQRPIVAALGKSWDSQIDENLFVSKTNHSRKLKVVYSPKAATAEASFRIEINGGFIAL